MEIPEYLNIAEACLARHAETELAEKTAMVFTTATGDARGL